MDLPSGPIGVGNKIYIIMLKLQNNYEKKLGFNDDTYTKAVDNGSYNNFIKDSAGYGLA